MNITLSGKRAVVSGSTSGIGYAIVAGLALAGAHVILNGREGGRVDEAVRRLKADIPEAAVEGIAADLGTADGVAAFLAKAPAVDILVNNLGIYEHKPFFDIQDEDWESFFSINVLSGVRLSRHYLPGMIERGWGRIVFVSSESGVQIPVDMIHYGMTKTAQLAISRGLAELAAGSGVTVNAVLPGPTRSEGVGRLVADMARTQGKTEAEVEAAFFATARPSSLIKRFAEVEEVANLVVYACSEQASATTGAALRVDGGIVRSIV